MLLWLELESLVFVFKLANLILIRLKGCFNLDPNRVLDIILESFENNPLMYQTFIGLLKHYKADDETICQIIGFKFQSLHQQQQLHAKNHKSDSDVCMLEDRISVESLYTVTSYLLKYKIIDLDLLMSHVRFFCSPKSDNRELFYWNFGSVLHLTYI